MQAFYGIPSFGNELHISAGDFTLPSIPIGLSNDSSIGFSAKNTISGIFSHGLAMRRPTARVSGGGWDGELAVEAGKAQSQKHASKNAARTHRQLHAVLGGFLLCRLG